MATMPNLCVILALVAGFTMKSPCLARTWNATFTPNPSFRYTGSLAGNFSVKSDLHCGLKCGVHNECNAYNVGPVEQSSDDGGNSRSCELVSANYSSSAEVFGEELGWIYMHLGDALERGGPSLFDCFNLTQNSPVASSGVYTLLSDAASHPLSPKDAYCEMETDGGGWTVIVRRFDESGDFNRSWDEFKHGFGDTSGEYWLGNEYLHYLASSRAYKLRFNLEDWDGNTAYAEYSSFLVESEDDDYRLRLGDYNGTTDVINSDNTHGFLNFHNMQFSTYDRNHDRTGGRCTGEYGYGGFWMKACPYVAPTNQGCGAPSCSPYHLSIMFSSWRGRASLRKITMMFRPA